MTGQPMSQSLAETIIEGVRLSSGVGERYWDAEVDRGLEAQMRESGKGLYIFGAIGSGKTHIASALTVAACKRGEKARLEAATQLLRNIRDTFGGGTESEKDLIWMYANYDLLAIDDLGKEKATEFALATVFDIIDARYSNNRPTIITTQYTDDELLIRWGDDSTGEAILSRLHEVCLPIRLTGKDRRSL